VRSDGQAVRWPEEVIETCTLPRSNHIVGGLDLAHERREG
jgi:hypothetical protein